VTAGREMNMESFDLFKSILEHHRDQWEAHCRDWIVKQSDDDILTFTKYLMDMTRDGADIKMLSGYFALLGLVSAWVHATDSEVSE
jgi:hypothetical protein